MTITTQFRNTAATGARKVTAKCNGKQKTLPYDYALSVRGNHIAAAQQFAPVYPGTHTIEVDNGKARFVV